MTVPRDQALSVEAALRLALSMPLPCRAARVPLAEALGRTLAAAVTAQRDAPAEDHSAMDGYAVVQSDLAHLEPGDPPRFLPVQERVAAGHPPRLPLRPGAAARVMTGATLPVGADAVIMQEHALRENDAVGFSVAPTVGQHVRRRGSDHRAGDVLLPAGARLGPEALGLLAAQGLTELAVWARPRVAILSTGDELAAPGAPLRPGQRWASNATALCALVEEAGGEAFDCGIAPDDAPGARAAVAAALSLQPDLLLSSGGVSVGDFDVMQSVFVELGAVVDHWRVAMKPGKPLLIGRLNGVRLFGLPGNPLSSTTTFRLFVRTLIRASLGDPAPLLPILTATVQARLAHRPGRAELLPVLLETSPAGLLTRPQPITGSGSTRAASLGGALALLGADRGPAEVGDAVPVLLLSAPLGLGAAPEALRWGGRQIESTP